MTAALLIAVINEPNVSCEAKLENVNDAPDRSAMVMPAGAPNPAPPLRFAVRTLPITDATREPDTEVVPVKPKRPRSRAVR